MRARLFSAFKIYSKNGKTKSADEYGINYEAIIKYIGPKPDDIQDWHIDHIIPLASFDFDDIEQIQLAFSPENHQWLIAKENYVKGSKLPWMICVNTIERKGIELNNGT